MSEETTKAPKFARTFIGIKVVQAWPRSEGDVKPGIQPSADDPLAQGRQGYAVLYPDNYLSWSPADVFEEAYMVVPEQHAQTILERLQGELARAPDLIGAPIDFSDAEVPPVAGPRWVPSDEELRTTALQVAANSYGPAGPDNTNSMLGRAKDIYAFLKGVAPPAAPE